MTRFRAQAALWILFLAVQLGALAFTVGIYGVAPAEVPQATPETPTPDTPNVEQPTTEQPSETPSNEPMRGVLFLLIIITETAIILAFKRVARLRNLFKKFISKMLKMPWWVPAFALIIYAAYRTPADKPFFILGLATVAAVSYPIGAHFIAPMLRSDSWWALNLKALFGGSLFTALFADSLGPTPILVFLVLMMFYDFIAVYITGHMIELAESIPAWAPVFFAIPRTREKFWSSSPVQVDMGEGDFHILGLGDAVLPAILVTTTVVYYGAAGSIAALGALVGAQVGFGVLMLLMTKYDRSHAGLPPILTGTLAGWYLAPLLF